MSRNYKCNAKSFVKITQHNYSENKSAKITRTSPAHFCGDCSKARSANDILSVYSMDTNWRSVCVVLWLVTGTRCSTPTQPGGMMSTQLRWPTCLHIGYTQIISGANCKGSIEDIDCCTVPHYEDTLQPEMNVLVSPCTNITGSTDCSWYEDCLEARYPCFGTEHDYAIAFGLKFCKLFNKYRSQFTQNGQKWVDSVTKCLQMSLIPFLQQPSPPSHIATCAHIKRVAFESHSSCYLKPGPSQPSVCDLPAADWVVGSYVVSDNLDWSIYYETISQSYEVVKGCGVGGLVKTSMGGIVMALSFCRRLCETVYYNIVHFLTSLHYS